MLPIVVSLILTMGLTWIFYPALLVAWSDEVKWEETQLTADGASDQNEDVAKKRQSVVLSLVIPAYNEEDRIFVMLQAAHKFLESSAGNAVLARLSKCAEKLSKFGKDDAYDSPTTVVEWIIVNDGSKDGTCSAVKDAYAKLSKEHVTKSKTTEHFWKLITLNVNSGKGAAVKTGMLSARGKFRLMVDADGATDFGPGLELLVKQLCTHVLHERNDRSECLHPEGKQNEEELASDLVAILGSRAHLQNKAVAQRSLVRTLLMHAFHFFVSMLVSSRIRDTQCGFKLFTESAAKLAFGSLHLRRWAFDTELIMVCNLVAGTNGKGGKNSSIRGIQLFEVGVPWQEVEGSKLNTSKFALAWVSLSMLRDMICVRACYSLGIWKVKQEYL